MLGSGILDTVIGMLFVFLLVSMLVTIMNEMIAARLMSRAKLLREGIDRLLGSKWASDLYAHPLIEGSARNGAAMKAGQDGPSYIPSRSFANVLMDLVAKNSDALAATRKTLYDVLDEASSSGASLAQLRASLATAAVSLRTGGGVGAAIAVDLQRRLDASSTIPVTTTTTTPATSPESVAPAPGWMATGQRLAGPYTVGDAIADFRWFADSLAANHVRHLIEELPDGHAHIRTVLLTLFDDAGHDVEKFKQNIEVWFNHGMDRVSGWYKRHSQLVITALSVLTVVTLNVDAVAIFRHLQTDQGAREALAAKASAYVEAQKAPAPVLAPSGTPALAPAMARTLVSGVEYNESAQIVAPGRDGTVDISSTDPTVTIVTPTFAVSKQTVSIPFTVRSLASDKPRLFDVVLRMDKDTLATLHYRLNPSLEDQFDGIHDELMALSLPIGWVATETSAGERKNGMLLPGTIGEGWKLLQQHCIGWLLTALAATLGAPFWFDTLNRIISIRATGKAPEEDPKSPKSVSMALEPGQSPQEADRLRGSGRRN